MSQHRPSWALSSFTLLLLRKARKPLRRRLALLIPALLATPALLLSTAALADGRLEGQVSDRSGARLAGAEVRRLNTGPLHSSPPLLNLIDRAQAR